MNDEKTFSAAGSVKTDPLLIRAWKVLDSYSKTTGAMVCVLDHNYLPIPENFAEVLSEKNTCLFCLKYQIKYQVNGAIIRNVQDTKSLPCSLMHSNAVKAAYRFGGSYLYMCDLGFMFWTSPLFADGRFAGALIGTGFLGIDSRETAEAMSAMSGVPPEELVRSIAVFPRSDPEQIRAMAELLHICAESLSVGKEDYHETLKRRANQQSSVSKQISLLKNQYPQGEAPGYPLDKERLLLASLRRGDYETGRKILNELLGILFFSNPDHFRFIQFRAIELVVLLSRAAVVPGNTEAAIIETNNRYLKRIQQVQTIEELTDVLHIVVENMAGQIFSFQGIRHATALRKAERFIDTHYTRKISLREIARVSGLSASYFSTIFRDEMGENFSSYLNRLRVERACRMLTETDTTLSEIASICGFEDQSWFSKIFKSYTGLSPGKYRKQGGGSISEISEENFSPAYRTTIKTTGAENG
ncbi:hypothetical protein FACS1894142_0310 [Spirochaetia bacterium]|nr:hypothetical protein FACS1894142_0310 [Spirochaetia bacterium]